MIVFLNFAPIEFMGGVERQLAQLFVLLNPSENVQVICYSPKLANAYSRVVLKRNFDDHSTSEFSKVLKATNYISFLSFIPFTQNWFLIRQKISEARVIYVKFEVLEILTLVYFGGMKAVHKSIAAVRSPLFYPVTSNVFDKLHNFVYTKRTFLQILRKFKAIHVLNKRDEKYLTDDLEIEKVVYIPNSLQFKISKIRQSTNREKLNVIYVGELSTRKGIDILIKVIEAAPVNYGFVIAGDGPSKKLVMKLEKNDPRVKYLGYLQKLELTRQYDKADVLLFPSRAETFGTVMIEASKRGAVILNRSSIKLGLPEYIEFSVEGGTVEGFIHALEKILKQKQATGLNREKISAFVSNYYSAKRINKEFRLLFSV